MSKLITVIHHYRNVQAKNEKVSAMQRIAKLSYLILFTVMVNLFFTESSVVVAKTLELNKDQIYLVFDPRLQGVGENCELKLHRFKRHPLNPVVKPDRPWEFPEGWRKEVDTSTNKGSVQLSCVLWEPDSQVFKMWYIFYLGFGDNFIDCYATSVDGIHWEKPNLGICTFNGSRDNNILMEGTALCNIQYNPRMADTTRRYIGFEFKPSNWFRVVSPDGLRWRREPQESVLSGYPNKFMVSSPYKPASYEANLRYEVYGGDGLVVFWAENLEKYIAIYKVCLINENPAPDDEPKNQHYQRAYARMESTDGMKWDAENMTMAFNRDGRDMQFDEYLQFYNISVHPVGDFYLAFPWLYHSNDGDFDIGFACSTDTIRWERPFRGQYVLPKGDKGQWDCGMVMTNKDLIEKDGLWWFYYSGTPYLHRKYKNYCAIGLAQTPIGRVVSARSWRKEGTWTVGPVKIAGRELLVNAAVLDSMRVTILDEQGNPIPGYKSQVIRGNDIEIPVLWEDDEKLSDLGGRAVKLRFELNDAEIFGFTCK